MCIVYVFVAVVCMLLIALRPTVVVFTRNIYPRPPYVYVCVYVQLFGWFLYLFLSVVDNLVKSVI